MSGYDESKTGGQEFGPWLRRQREIDGKTRKQVAAAVGIHPVQLARIETGESGTRKDTLDALIAELALDAKEAYTKAGFWPPEQPKDAGEPDQRAQEAARTVEMIENWTELSPERQQQTLDFLKFLKSQHPEDLKVLGPKFKVQSSDQIDPNEKHVEEVKKPNDK